MNLLNQIKERAKNAQKVIILPESFEPRTLNAAAIILKESLAKVILIGKKKKLLKAAQLAQADISNSLIIDPENYPQREQFSQYYYNLRKNKGVTPQKAFRLAADPLYLAALLVQHGHADGYVAGAENTTGDVLRPALQIIRTSKGISVVSGAMIMILPEKRYGQNGIIVVADCAVNPNPTEEQLSEIAFCTAQTASKLAKIDPKIAMLSFSTKGSARHEMVNKVINATVLCQRKYPALKIDGELQFDAAVVPEVAQRKAPGSSVAGHANTFIFPDLQAGNIAIKIIERFGGATAIGPILQGIAKPVNDLSRGCSIDDIVNTVSITAIQALD